MKISSSFPASLFIGLRFYLIMALLMVLFVLGYPFPVVLPVAKALLSLFVLLVAADMVLLYLPGSSLKASRRLPTQLSLGETTQVGLQLQSRMKIPVSLRITDEAPYQLQLRDLLLKGRLAPGEKLELSYSIRPLERGHYEFGRLRVFASSVLGLLQRRYSVHLEETIAVYPSVPQMRRYELKVFQQLALNEGIKRVRRMGQHSEFEQIKNYVSGDDYRHINWKATSRHNALMVNQYEEEKAQQVYCLIDKSRAMRMPFDGMTLLDYAINSSLVISNIALRKSDRAGLLTFSHKLGSRLRAERSPGQIKKILEVLYRQKTHFLEANYELLYFGVRNFIKGRSLLLLFTNFESSYSLQRVLPLLRRLNQQHLLVVVFFENTGLSEASQQATKTVGDIYFRTIAQKLAYEKQLIADELRKHAIQTILTTPARLSVDTINKYLELKSRGLI